MSDLYTHFATDTRPDGASSPYRWNSLAGNRGSQEKIYGELAIGTDNLTANDKWYLANLPQDFRLEDVIIRVDDLDSDGTPALDLQVKYDDGSVTSFNAADKTTGQAGGTFTDDQNTPLNDASADYQVYVEVTTAAATAQAGNCYFEIRGSRIPIAS